MIKVIHISTIHPRRDTRVFYRECLSLQNTGYKVYFIVADGLGDEFFKGLEIIDLGKNKSRAKNFFKTYFQLKTKINELKPDLVHFHDAELMFIGTYSHRKGVPTFYDIHENVAEQILDKKHFSPLIRKPLHYIYKFIEKLLINQFHLILAEYSYSSIYSHKGKSCTVVLNLPERNAFQKFIVDNRKDNGVFYIGGISNDRGLDTTIEALHILKSRNIDFFMHYIGPKPLALLKTLNLEGLNNNIKFYDRMDLIEGYELSKKCKVGLAVLKPIKNYIGSYPTKIFEYMSIKLPVITSNFELYKDVVEKNKCGFCIDPFSPEDLASKIEIIIKDETLAKRMGINGFKAIEEKFNWKHEERKLHTAYDKAIN